MAGHDVGGDQGQGVPELRPIDTHRDQFPLGDLQHGPGERLEPVQVEKSARSGDEPVAVEPFRLRRVLLHELHRFGLDGVQTVMLEDVGGAGVDVLVDLAPVSFVGVVEVRRRDAMEAEHIRRLRFHGAPRRRVHRRVRCVGRLHRSATHAGQAAALSLSDLDQPVRGRVELRFVLQGERDRIAESGQGRRGDHVDATVVREADELLTDPHSPAHAVVAGHGLQWPVDVVGLILGGCEELDERRRPGPAHRLALAIAVDPSAPAAVVTAAVHVPQYRPSRRTAPVRGPRRR